MPKRYETIFKKYSDLVEPKWKAKVWLLPYFPDDANPYDEERKNPYRSANILLLTPELPNLLT